MSRSQLFACLCLGLLAQAAAAAEEASPAWRIYTEKAGLHRIGFEEIEAAQAALAPLPSAALSLENRGRLVPFLLEDGGDGEFGPGDWLEFAAEIVRGTTTYFHPYARHNVYWLRLDPARARHLAHLEVPAQEALAAAEPIVPLRILHLEQDKLLIRLSAQAVNGDPEPELWYWAKLTHLSETPFVADFDVSDADLAIPANVRAAVRGISSIATARGTKAEMPEHRLELASGGGTFAAQAVWDGQDTFVIERRNFILQPGEEAVRSSVALSVPARMTETGPLVDVVMVDWVEVSYSHNGRLTTDQAELRVPPGEQGGVLELEASSPGKFVVVGPHLGHVELEFQAPGRVRLPLPENETSVWVRRGGAAYSATAIEADRSSSLRAYDRQADYLVLAHVSLLDAARELAQLHRDRGLTVELIDVQDIYDEFGDGLVSPTAIRDFLVHAYHNWQPPSPRFVLLVGDASWDTKNSTVDEANYANWVGDQLLRGDRFVAKKTDDYDDSKLNVRNLIPSWNYHTVEGHAASDAYYTLLDGDDELPDVALGRLPVASPEEVLSITRKVRSYIEEAPLGPWRSRVLWISGALTSHQRRSQMLAQEFQDEGKPATIILPGAKAKQQDKRRIVDALDSGSLITHFIGHGGRFIWRTGPPDLSNQVDLFGLDDLETLRPTERLSIVLSVACYSAPFDHPSADSIGEAFLRLPDRGAVAFIGASWRNAPPVELSRSLVQELSQPGTIGEALMRTKRTMRRPDSIHLFNLLGDPGVPTAAPQEHLEVDYHQAAAGLEVAFELPEAAVGGRVAIDFLDKDGGVLESRESVSEARAMRVGRPLDSELRAVTVYFWNDATGVDGVGAVKIAVEPEVETAGR